MTKKTMEKEFFSVWQHLRDDWKQPAELCRLGGTGVGIGLLVGMIISLFRLAKDSAYSHVIAWANSAHPLWQNIIWIFLATFASVIVIALMRNPAIRSGGAPWITQALEAGQPGAWRKILFPKFLGSWVVLACGLSVGSEGPCIQMGAAAALGLKNFNQQQELERRYFILAGCACGLAAAFSAPFAGVCYVYEVMKEKFTSPLLFFLMAGGIGVYFGCTQIFGLDILVPLGSTPMPPLHKMWILLPLALLAATTGIAYNYALRGSIKCYSLQKLISWQYCPIIVFAATSLIVLYCPAITGEGMTIFPAIQAGKTLLGYLVFFLFAKLIFTAFCYGSGVPAGIMVPVLCLGGVAGAIYADCLQCFGLIEAEYAASCIVMGMAAAFAAAEQAPLTAFVLVAEMTGAWSASLGLIMVAAIGAFLAGLARVRAV